jgi:hypothetical protein
LDQAHFTEELHSACYALDEDKMPQDSFPLSYQLIGKFQSKGKEILVELKKTKSRYVIKPFEGGGTTRNLICYHLCFKILHKNSMYKMILVPEGLRLDS